MRQRYRGEEYGMVGLAGQVRRSTEGRSPTIETPSLDHYLQQVFLVCCAFSFLLSCEETCIDRFST